MKRSIACLLALLMIASLAACGTGAQKPSAAGNGSLSELLGEKTDSAAAPSQTSGNVSASSSTDSIAPVQKTDDYEVGEGRAVTYTDSIGTVWVQISVPVKNTGTTDLYLDSGTMDLEDADGHLVDSKSLVPAYPDVLRPGETAWYYEETILEELPDSELKVIPHVDVKSAKISCIRYEVSDVSLTDQTYGGIKITGRVENTTSGDESFIYVVVYLYDVQDALLCQALTIMTDTLKAGEKMGFSAVTWTSNDAITTEAVARYEVYAFPLQYQF